MKRIAIYGKGGIGKSTTTSNLSAALCQMGLKVMQIGCDPKSDSTMALMNGERIPTVLDLMREKKNLGLNEIVFKSGMGIFCVEAGGPTPGIGCAGRGIITAFDQLNKVKAYEICKPDIVIYDVLGDVVCGGFAMPMRGEYADCVFVVTSGEMMSMYAAANIVKAVSGFKKRGYARFGGYILNRRNVENELENVERLAAEEGGSIIADIPRSPYVQQAEKLGKTVIEAFPDTDMARKYFELAENVYRICGEAGES